MSLAPKEKKQLLLYDEFNLFVIYIILQEIWNICKATIALPSATHEICSCWYHFLKFIHFLMTGVQFFYKSKFLHNTCGTAFNNQAA